jgi:hypothetical protein
MYVDNRLPAVLIPSLVDQVACYTEYGSSYFSLFAFREVEIVH